jgi:hypothetical protein
MEMITYCRVRYIEEEEPTLLLNETMSPTPVKVQDFDARTLHELNNIIDILQTQVKKEYTMCCCHCRAVLDTFDLVKNRSHVTMIYAGTPEATTIDMFITIAVIHCAVNRQCSVQATAWLDEIAKDLRHAIATERPSVSYARQCANPACARVSKDKFLKCSKCHTNYYCCETCQRLDWKAHKKICKRKNI